MRSDNKRKKYNVLLVLIFVFNLFTQAAIPAVVYATEGEDTSTQSTEVNHFDGGEVTPEPKAIETKAVSAPLDLPIMHINDTHSNVGSLAYMVNEIEKYRAANDNSILLHAGDSFTGTLYFNQYEGLADLEIFKIMQVDAMIFGNHEFDFGNTGHAALAEFVRQASFPFIASNVNFENNNLLKGSVVEGSVVEDAENGKIHNSIVLDVDGQKVGVFGLTTEDTINIASPVDVTFSNYIKAAEKAVADFKAAGINKIIAMTHIGYASNPDVGNDRVLAQTVPGIDVIVGGHSHTPLSTPVEINNAKSDGPTVVVQTGGNGGSLGTLNVSFDENGVITEHKGELVSVQTNPNNGGILADSVAATFAKYETGVKEIENTVVDAIATTTITNPRFNDTNTTDSVRANETALGNLVTDAMLNKAKELFPDVQIAFQNSGGIRAPISAGPITLGEIYSVLPFGNNPVVLTLSGQEIKEIMEHAVSVSPGESGGFLQISGMKYFYDSQREPYDRVVKMQVVEDGELTDLEMGKIYSVTTNAYTAGGGDGFDTLKKAYDEGRVIDFGEVDWEQFRDYLVDLQAEKGEVNPVIEGRIIDLNGTSLEPEEIPVVELSTKVPNSDVIITVTGEGLGGLTLVVRDVADDVDKVPTVLGSNYDLYDISLVDEDGEEVQPEGTVSVTISLKDGLTPEKVFHFGDNFEFEKELDFEVIDGTIVFTTDSFSYFGVRYAAAPGETPGEIEIPSTPGIPNGSEETDATIEENKDLPATGSSIIVPLMGGMSLILAGLGTEIYRKKKYKE